MAVELSNVPDSMFNRVIKVREIAKATLCSKDVMAKMGKEPADGDIMLEYANGKKQLITRMELIHGFMNLNNKKIIMAGWHYNKTYNVMRNSREPMAMLKIPRITRITIACNGGSIPKGSAVVCELKDNSIRKDRPEVYEPRDFFKQFIVEQKADYLSAKREIRNIKLTAQLTKEREERRNYKALSEKDRIEKKVDHEIEAAKLMAVGRIANQQGKICGFAISDGRQTKLFNISQTKELCRQKKIRNVVIVLNSSGTQEFLRGNGIRIDNLPVKQM